MQTVVIEGNLKTVVKKDLEEFDLRILWLNKNVGSNLCFYATEKEVRVLVVTLQSFQKVSSFLSRDHPILVVCNSTSGLPKSQNVQYVTPPTFLRSIRSVLQPISSNTRIESSQSTTNPRVQPQAPQRVQPQAPRRGQVKGKKEDFRLDWGALNWSFEETNKQKKYAPKKLIPQAKRATNPQRQIPRPTSQSTQQPSQPLVDPTAFGFGDDGGFFSIDSPVPKPEPKKENAPKPTRVTPEKKIIKNIEALGFGSSDSPLFSDDGFGITSQPSSEPKGNSSSQQIPPRPSALPDDFTSFLKTNSDLVEDQKSGNSSSTSSSTGQPISLLDLGDEIGSSGAEEEMEEVPKQFSEDDPFFITASPQKKKKRRKIVKWNDKENHKMMEEFMSGFKRMLETQVSRTRLRRHSITLIPGKEVVRGKKKKKRKKKKKSHVERVLVKNTPEKPLSPVSETFGVDEVDDIDSEEEMEINEILFQTGPKRKKKEEEEEESEGEDEEEEEVEASQFEKLHRNIKAEREVEEGFEEQKRGLLRSDDIEDEVDDGELAQVLFKNTVVETPSPQERKKVKIKKKSRRKKPLPPTPISRERRGGDNNDGEDEEVLLDQLFRLFTLQSASSASREGKGIGASQSTQKELQKLILESPLLRKINRSVLSLKPNAASSSSLLEPRQVALVDGLLDRVESYLKNLFLLKRAYIQPITPHREKSQTHSPNSPSKRELGRASPPSPAIANSRNDPVAEEKRRILIVETHRALFDSVSKFAPQTSVFLRECWKLFGKKAQRRSKEVRKVQAKHLHHCVDLIVGFIQRFGKVYREYHSNFVKLMRLLKEEKRTNDMFSVFLKTTAMEIQGMGGKVVQNYGKIQVFHLSSFLALPILHFPEYAQFLKDVLDLDVEMFKERERSRGKALTTGKGQGGPGMDGSGMSCWSKKKRSKAEKSHQFLHQWMKKCSFVFLDAVRLMKFEKAKVKFGRILPSISPFKTPKRGSRGGSKIPVLKRQRTFIFDSILRYENIERKTRNMMVHLFNDCMVIEDIEKNGTLKLLMIGKEVNFSMLAVKNPHVFVLFYPYEDGLVGRERNMIFRFICKDEGVRNYFVRAISNLKKR